MGSALRSARQIEGTTERPPVPDEYRDVKSASGPRYETAKRWLEWFAAEATAYCSFKVFAVDQESFQRFPYRGQHGYPFRIWKSTLTSFVAGVTWSLRRPRSFPTGILLDIVCDSSADEDFLRALDTLPRDLKLDMRQRRRIRRQRLQRLHIPEWSIPRKLPPMLRVHEPVQLCSSDPAKALSGLEAETEFVQLTDVILGSLWDATRARMLDEHGRSGRVRLSRLWAETDHGDVTLPWSRPLPLSRAVSVSMYPDEHGRAYSLIAVVEPHGHTPFSFYNDCWVDRRDRKRRIQTFLDEGEPSKGV